jgi:iron complex outermembrane receptor protein
VDMQLSYKLTENASLDISGVNLTNEMQRQYYQFGAAGNQQVSNFGTLQMGRSFAVGLRWKM